MTPKVYKNLLLGLLLLLASSVFAADKVSLSTPDAVTVGGKQLKAGDYTLRWEGNGPNVQLNVLRGKKVLATVPAHIVDSTDTVDTNTFSYTNNSDGSKTLSRIQVKGQKSALEIGGEASASN